MILMFSTFDVLIECSLDEKAEKEFMTVGWGKKETQFHGSVGKDNRKKAEIEIKNIEELNKTITCCWRGDGEYFAVNFVGSNGRMFKVFNKEGSMQYVSELCENLQVPIAWKSSGLWIAKPEILKNKYVITLFERNGLKHFELVLPFSPDIEEVTNLSWNQDSDILLIETNRNGIYTLYFYTICNYHWYMKYHIEYSFPIVYNWSQNFAEPKKLHIMDVNGKYSILKFDYVVNHSNGNSNNDETVVAVLDGHKLLLTNFKSQMLPPPMASLEVTLENPANVVNFIQSSTEFDSNSFMTIDQANVATFYRCIFNDAINGRKFNSVEKVKSVQLKNIENVVHSLWIDSFKLLVTSEHTIFLYSTDSESMLAEIMLEDVVAGIVKINESLYAAQLIDGTLIGIEVNENGLSISDKEFPKLPELCEKVVPVVKNDVMFYGHKNLKKKLYLNSKEIANEVTSFTVTNDQEFLIYTTIGELKFVKIDKNPEEVIDTRRIERGSKIISLVKDKSQIIFQLPRGNLETISPRILSFKIIRKHLEVPNYKTAFDLLRKERINLNLLIDMQPQKFLNEIEDFVLQIDNINWLNLFLTELKNEDVTTTMYKFCDKIEEGTDESFTFENKIQFICEEMLDIFERFDQKKYLLPSITSHVKNENLEKALQLIWDLKKAGGNDKEADDAIKYLLYLIDINVLYNIALGMYDYQLVMFVAQKSQKDPKEYVPFLQELKSFDPFYAKYKIDCFLKRYTKAVSNISSLCAESSEKFDECIELIKKHSLYEAALFAFDGYKNCYQKICILYGDHLRVKGKFLEAILMYERGGDYKQALSSARNILDWKKCLVLARKCNYNESEVNDLASKLTHSLIDLGRFKEACEIIRKFNEDPRLLIETLVHGRYYDEALLEISFIDPDNQFINEIIRPNIVNHFNETIKAIGDDKATFLLQKSRLLSIRQEKIRKIQNPQEDDDDDTFSDTTSINSQSSRNTAKTFRSSKQKRKHERKLLNLKEGNKFEDVALLDSIWKLVHKIVNSESQCAIKELIVAGIELNMDDYSGNLQVISKTFKTIQMFLILKHLNGFKINNCKVFKFKFFKTVIFPLEILQRSFADTEALSG